MAKKTQKRTPRRLAKKMEDLPAGRAADKVKAGAPGLWLKCAPGRHLPN